MKPREIPLNCQILDLDRIAEGDAEVPRMSLNRRIKLMIRRRLSPSGERTIKRYTNDWLNRICKMRNKKTKPYASKLNSPSARLQEGDWVRVRSLEEIEETLNHWRQVRGCTFMPEMAEYCGTIRRVVKPMQRFVDERDLRVKKSSGIILLEGVMCQGTAEFGSCDRSCLHFWRQEWLEKVDGPPDSAADVPSARLQEGDWVRVRSLEEIEETLNHWRQVRGCTFMPEMAEYCGTIRRVLKPMQRFVDERDLRVKKSSGIILLEGAMCQGRTEVERCDRLCYYLWRQEWLENLDGPLA